MKRLLAILVFVSGGLAAELAHPVNCSLLCTGRTQLKRQRR
ncbi:hypothetical protein [Paraburkholderia aromaticivorans]|nr:hypothetical protein [Paraburkholderia aromaticivorans]